MYSHYVNPYNKEKGRGKYFFTPLTLFLPLTQINYVSSEIVNVTVTVAPAPLCAN